MWGTFAETASHVFLSAMWSQDWGSETLRQNLNLDFGGFVRICVPDEVYRVCIVLVEVLRGVSKRSSSTILAGQHQVNRPSSMKFSMNVYKQQADWPSSWSV